MSDGRTTDVLIVVGKVKRIVTGTTLGLLALAGCATPSQELPAQQDGAVLVQELYEDDPRWNCYTDGNGDCGNVTTVVMPDGATGAILSAASDGLVYVSWSDGTVSHATHAWRSWAWLNCVQEASGTDASLAECDSAFQEVGDRFHV